MKTWQSILAGAGVAALDAFYQAMNSPGFDLGDSKTWLRAVAIAGIGAILAKLKTA